MLTVSQKLDRIILPHVEFRSTLLVDGLEYLAQLIVLHDPDGENIYHPGVPIVWCGVPDEIMQTRRVSLFASGCSLRVVLSSIAKEAGLCLMVNQSAAFLVPQEVMDGADAYRRRFAPAGDGPWIPGIPIPIQDKPRTFRHTWRAAVHRVRQRLSRPWKTR